MNSSNLSADPKSLTESSNESRTDSELNEEFQSLSKRINKILNQSEFEINNGEYICQQHCNELRRQVQLAKETQMLKIEEITDKLMNEIDQFEKESLETVSKVNKKQLVNKLKEMKQENEKWNQELDELKVDNQMLNQLKDKLSKIAFERDNFNSLLHNKMMKFKEYKDQSFVGELSPISLDSFEQIFIKKHLEEDVTGLTIATSFEFKEGKILSNGDLLLCGQIRDKNRKCHDLVLAVFDLNKDFKLKKIKKFCVDYNSMATSSDKICLTYEIIDSLRRYQYQATNVKVGDYVVLILNENLGILNRYKRNKMILIGANDSFLFFMNDSEHKDGVVSFYSWSMEYVKTIGQSNDPNLPFYISRPSLLFNNLASKFVNMLGRYFFISFFVKQFKIVDEETGILLKTIDKTEDFCIDNNNSIILKKLYEFSIQYLSFNGDLLKKIEMKNYNYFFLLNNDKRCFVYDAKDDRLCFWNKYDENTHEIVY